MLFLVVFWAGLECLKDGRFLFMQCILISIRLPSIKTISPSKSYYCAGSTVYCNNYNIMLENQAYSSVQTLINVCDFSISLKCSLTFLTQHCWCFNLYHWISKRQTAKRKDKRKNVWKYSCLLYLNSVKQNFNYSTVVLVSGFIFISKQGKIFHCILTYF